ncbi:SGNH/GDSL hydrolase family protein [Marinoscillum furvescens]|nr:GDSL-type esterase/lipase family protein [Marinoscillum furvescens]
MKHVKWSNTSYGFQWRSLCFVLAYLVMFTLAGQVSVINAGVGGNNTFNLLDRLEEDVLQKHPGMVILMVGTNDMLNSRKMLSYATYADNLKLIVSRIKQNGAEVLLLSPPPVDTSYLFDRHDRDLFTDPPNVRLDSAKAIMQKLATDSSVHFLDLNLKFRALNLPNHNQDLFIKNERNSSKRDGVHPTGLGYHFIAMNVYHILLEHALVSANMKIICFGDSITRGGGSEADWSYPNILSKLLNADYK